MNRQELIKRAIEGRQNSSLEYMKRFSLCDCLTLGFPDTYNALGLGLEAFNAKLSPGKKYVMPYADKVSEHDLKILRPVGYKTPKKIETFMWSPFHDATSSFYNLGDHVRHSFRFKGDWLKHYPFVTKLSRPSFKQVRTSIEAMRQKVKDNWGDITSILIFYDYSRMNNREIKNRMDKYREISLEVLHDWHHLRVKLTPEDKTGKQWEHYKRTTRDNLYNQIEAIENAR